MRDNNETKKYFEDYIKRQESKINTVKAMVDFNNPNPMAIHMLFRPQFDKVIGLFSIGAPKEDLVTALQEVLKTCEYKDDMEYDDLVKLLSLSVLLDVDCNAGLKEIIYYKIDTFLCMLTDYLKITPDCEIEPNNYDPYEFLFYHISKDSSKDDVERVLMEYLQDEWYDLCDEWHWYESLGGRTYAGYWCLEAMAIAKIYGVDTTKLEELDYFSKI